MSSHGKGECFYAHLQMFAVHSATRSGHCICAPGYCQVNGLCFRQQGILRAKLVPIRKEKPQILAGKKQLLKIFCQSFQPNMYEQRFYSVWQYFHIFPRCCKVLHLSLHVTSMFSTFFYFFLHLKPRFPHRVETALAFSGGGGRALAFSLGVLRALEHLGLMRLEWFCSATSGSHCDMIT